MSDSLLLLAGLGAIFVATAVTFATLAVIKAERAQMRRSLDAMDAYRNPHGVLSELARPFSERVIKPGLWRLVRIGRMLTPGWQIERIRRKLDEAGGPAGWDLDRVLA
ncbi:MAG: hypothetical protein ACRDV2_03860, partial [Actinomycetes bacterium]